MTAMVARACQRRFWPRATPGFCRLALCLAVSTSVTSAPAGAAGENPGWELLVTNAGPPVPRTCFQAPSLAGSAPQGAFFIGGPAKFELGAYRFQSFFDGYGRMNKFEIFEREICYTSTWLNTSFWRAGEAAVAEGQPPRGILFEDTTPARPPCPTFHPMCELSVTMDNNWVSMIDVGGEALLLSDTTTMVRMDPSNLRFAGVKKWEDDRSALPGGRQGQGMQQPNWTSAEHIAVTGSAHPLRRPGTHEIVDILTELPFVKEVEHSIVDVYSFDLRTSEQQTRKHIASIKVDNSHYLHSFGVTPNYVVLPFNLFMQMPNIIGATLLGQFHGVWRGVQLVDYAGGVQAFTDMDPFYHMHIVNAFENETGVILDVGVYASNPLVKAPALDLKMFLNKTERNSVLNKAHVRRLHFHLAGPLRGKTTTEDFENPKPGRSVDFYKINMALSGLQTCIYYATESWHDGVDYASMAILKHDTCRGVRSYWHQADVYPGEPFFIAGGPGGAEDDGVVVFIALDGQRRRSSFIVLDARTFRELAVVELPVHIPFTAHGQFIQQAKEARSFWV